MKDATEGASSHANKRCLDRISVGETITVSNRLCGQDLGRVANIHEQGFMMIGKDDVIFEGGIFQLDFVWGASSHNQGPTAFSLGAECLWRKPGEVQTWSGFTIIDKGDDDVAVIKRIVAAFAGQ